MFVLLEPSGAFLMQLSDQPAVRLTISRILFGCFFLFIRVMSNSASYHFWEPNIEIILRVKNGGNQWVSHVVCDTNWQTWQHFHQSAADLIYHHQS